MLDRGCGDRRPVGASGYRERDSVGLASWIKGLTISAASGVVCAQVQLPFYTRDHKEPSTQVESPLV